MGVDEPHVVLEDLESPILLAEGVVRFPVPREPVLVEMPHLLLAPINPGAANAMGGVVGDDRHVGGCCARGEGEDGDGDEEDEEEEVRARHWRRRRFGELGLMERERERDGVMEEGKGLGRLYREWARGVFVI